MSTLYHKVFEATVRGDDLCLTRIRTKWGQKVFQWPDSTKQTALEVACRHGYKDCLRILLDTFPIQKMKSGAKNAALVKALDVCCKAGRAECLDILLDAGADPDTVLLGDAENCLLHVTASYGHVNCCWNLLLHSAKVDVRSAKGLTPFHRAAQHLRLSVMRILLARGANPAASSQEGFHPLHLVALEQGTINPAANLVATNCMSLLLACRTVEVNVDSSAGFTPLHFACLAGNVAGAHMLLDYGANCRAKAQQSDLKKLPVDCILEVDDEDSSYSKQLLDSLKVRLAAEYKGCVRPLFLMCKISVKRLLGMRWQDKMDLLDVPINVKQAVKLV
eukprot:m.6756 g.6756  ORF g.6756 m.6756 type:complete len:334 (+) comp16796_c0_seq1:60-1061(+)